jgi:hypothetical protein
MKQPDEYIERSHIINKSLTMERIFYETYNLIYSCDKQFYPATEQGRSDIHSFYANTSTFYRKERPVCRNTFTFYPDTHAYYLSNCQFSRSICMFYYNIHSFYRIELTFFRNTSIIYPEGYTFYLSIYHFFRSVFQIYRNIRTYFRMTHQISRNNIQFNKKIPINSYTIN